MIIKRQIKLLTKICLLISLIFSSTNVYSCSAFLMKGNDYCIVGFNENWKSSPGLVIINKRNVVKKSLSWDFLISENKPSEKELLWTSKYGSVSFNLLGLDLPLYGINEKGLFVVELALGNTYSIPDSSKPNMFWAQWIQYQLDNFATVNEVVNNLNNSSIIDWWPADRNGKLWASHFFVTDKKGNTAAIELIDGKFQVSTGDSMPIQVLCNGRYQNELKTTQKYSDFGGDNGFNLYSKSWNDRFPKAAHLVKNYNKTTGITPVSYAWNVLDSINPGIWQIVVDAKKGIAYFRSDKGREIKSIDLSKCDFSKKSGVKYIDINSTQKGNVTDKFVRLTTEINDDYVTQGFTIGYDNPEFYKSNKFSNLKRNLHNYVLDKLK